MMGQWFVPAKHSYSKGNKIEIRTAMKYPANREKGAQRVQGAKFAR